jgi:S-adenosylmethionine:tRNA ribosyltransferase-isomerase
MPSAARPFTAELVTDLVARGVLVARSRSTAASPRSSAASALPERYRVRPRPPARERRRAGGGRVIAVGTTVVRALETVADADGVLSAGGLDDLVVTAERGVRAVDGLITGWHEPESSHLQLLEAVAGRSCSSAPTDAPTRTATAATSSATVT